MRNKKILILHSSSDLYGASKILIFTVTCLLSAGFEVMVVLSDEGPLVKQLEQTGVPVKIIRLGILRRKYFNIRGLFNRFHTIKAAKAQLTEMVLQNNIDIVYSNTAAVLVGHMVARSTKRKHVWHVHEIIDRPAFFSKFVGYLLKKADLIIVVSNQVKKHWEKVLGQTSKMKVIYNGLDYSPYLNASSTLRSEIHIPADKVLIGMIGRVNNWKGQRYFLEIAGLLLKRFDHLHFVMAGDAYPGYEYLYDELNAYKQQSGITAHVTDLGFRTDVPNILAGLDVFVLPSILPDPLPTTVLEAMATAKPVIATAHGGALEMVKELETGIFIPWDDARAAANIIAGFLSKEDIKATGKAGQKRVIEHFSLQAFQNNMISVISNL